MESGTEQPKEPSEKKGSDAAAMSARIVALKGDADEYAYTPPPPRPAPAVTPKSKRKGYAIQVVAAIVIFIGGAIVGNRLERKKLNRPPIAVINGEPISADDFAHTAEIPSGRAALQRLISEKMVLQFAKKKGVVPDQKALETSYEEQSRQPDFFASLKRTNQTPEDFRRALFSTLCRQAIFSNGMKVNPSDVRKYYDDNINPKNRIHRFYHEENVQLQVIVSPTQEGIDDAKKDVDGGMNFAAAVLKYSADVSKNRGGLLAPLVRGKVSSKFPELNKLIFDIPMGQVAGPVKVGNAFWLIKCLSHNPLMIDPFDKVQEDCLTGVLVDKGVRTNGAEIKKEEQDFMRSASIIINDPAYADMVPRRK